MMVVVVDLKWDFTRVGWIKTTARRVMHSAGEESEDDTRATAARVALRVAAADPMVFAGVDPGRCRR
jgi:hypothetical protein